MLVWPIFYGRYFIHVSYIIVALVMSNDISNGHQGSWLDPRGLLALWLGECFSTTPCRGWKVCKSGDTTGKKYHTKQFKSQLKKIPSFHPTSPPSRTPNLNPPLDTKENQREKENENDTNCPFHTLSPAMRYLHSSILYPMPTSTTFCATFVASLPRDNPHFLAIFQTSGATDSGNL